MSVALLSSAYFAPIGWYQKLVRHDQCLVERYDHYRKQTYRNRCLIATEGGVQALTVPVEHVDAGQTLMRDVRISDHGRWRQLHWNALCTAYGESPFFDYYADDLRPFFEERRWEFLYDFNWEITQRLCQLLDISPRIAGTESYRSPQPGELDCRDTITPKCPDADAGFLPRPYWQVYARRHGFQPGLSILDLLFCMGPEAVFYL